MLNNAGLPGIVGVKGDWDFWISDLVKKLWN